MTDYPPDPDDLPLTPPPSRQAPPAVPPSEQPAPLLGCLFCGEEGTITLTEGRKVFGLGSGLPTITCRACGAAALFDAAGEGGQGWRIRYKKTSRHQRYYYASIYLGGAGWLVEDEALAISRRAYVQRRRVQQAEAGDLSFLQPEQRDPPPPLMSPDEFVYVEYPTAIIGQASKTGESIMDSGIVFLTDKKIHLLGQRRDWSHKLSDIREITLTERYWRLQVGIADQYYQGENQPDQIDAQLFTVIVKALQGMG
ncbi:MAG TPA: hypothetical protein PLD47_04920 [Aggregatilineales bacterium]|nr:hypothetical protein [Anaerolineales bacterium]HRE47047.1 hypothetical protein [Aggregatilineales bacterium]